MYILGEAANMIIYHLVRLGRLLNICNKFLFLTFKTLSLAIEFALCLSNSTLMLTQHFSWRLLASKKKLLQVHEIAS